MKLRANVLAAIAYKRELHTKCGGRYAGGVKRVPVPDEKVNWSIDWPEYKPLDYTVPRKQVHSSRIDSDYRYKLLMYVLSRKNRSPGPIMGKSGPGHKY